MSQTDEHDDQAIQREELGIYAIIVAASLPVLIGLAIEGGEFDGGATLSMVLVVFGSVGLIAGVIAAVRAFVKPRLPVATVRRGS
jgi:hypothetical protein